MDICTAKRIIEGLVYKPTWTFEVTDHSKRIKGTVMVRVTFAAPNYDGGNAPGYADTINPSTPMPIMVEDLHSEDDLIFRLAHRVLLRIEEHELREALRVHRDGEWVAPFHPHGPDGINAWSARTGHPVERDLTFAAV